MANPFLDGPPPGVALTHDEKVFSGLRGLHVHGFSNDGGAHAQAVASRIEDGVVMLLEEHGVPVLGRGEPPKDYWSPVLGVEAVPLGADGNGAFLVLARLSEAAELLRTGQALRVYTHWFTEIATKRSLEARAFEALERIARAIAQLYQTHNQ